MPRRETRQSIERALAEQRRKRLALGVEAERRKAADVQREMTRLRKTLERGQSAEFHARFLRGVHQLTAKVFPKRRRPRDGSMPALVEPPRGPKPLQGGAAAPLEFD